jgi:type IV fimbrial biogenesis protein FimT
MKNHSGFTLIEVLISLAILLTVTSLGVPNFIDLTIKLRVDKEISLLYRLLLATRNSAINSGQTITLCPLNSNNQCSADWTLPLYVFTDKNDNKQFEPQANEKIITMKAAINRQDKLQYGKSRIGLSYAPTGHLSGWGQNATFKYCPINHANKSQGIIVATSGRIYKSYQSHSGKNKNRSGTVIICH